MAERAGIGLSEAQRGQFEQYLKRLLDANQRMNLTRIADPGEGAIRHVGDALTLLPYLPEGPHALVDVGSGGGVPGMILAIARPDARVTLVESTRKKAAFLSETASALGLENVVVLPQRVEEVGRSSQREGFDVATVRAVAPMVWLMEWCLPLLKVGGKLLAMKGQRLEEEMPAANKVRAALGGGEAVIHSAGLPGGEGHVIVEVPKQRRSDARYPRPPTQAKSRPLAS